MVETSSARGGRGTSHTGEEPGEGASRNEQHSHLSHSHLGGSRQLEKADRAATTSDSVLKLRCQNWCWGAWGSAQEGVDMLERGWREPTFEDEQMQKRSPPDSSPPPPCLALQKSELMMVHRGHQLRVSNDQPFIVALLQPTKCTQKLSSECEHRFNQIEFHTNCDLTISHRVRLTSLQWWFATCQKMSLFHWQSIKASSRENCCMPDLTCLNPVDP